MTGVPTDQRAAAHADDDPDARSFPPAFLWGAATSAYQTEGAVDQDGRGPSIWDTFTRTPGAIRRGQTGDVAVDHYRRYAEDVKLLARIGLNAYRFSVSWARVQPDGRGRPNPRGLDFYRRLVDCLAEHGIEPLVTLYHWDLPQALEDLGGWPARDTAYRFAEYALIVHDALGDRVRLWTTVNEPWCSAFLGYASGVHAPGVQDRAASLRAAHHLLLGHGLATAALRTGGPPCQVGLSLNFYPVFPASDHPADLAAAARIDLLQNRLFLEPVTAGAYPADIRAHIEPVAGLDHVGDGDEKVIAAPLDFLGVNYYMPYRVAAGHHPVLPSPWPGAEDVVFTSNGGPVTAMGWDIDADALCLHLERLHREHPGMPLLVTENGAAFEDRVDGDGLVRDPDRIAYLDSHLRAVHRAVARGVDVRGYFVWSLLDNFEWAEGYDKRFGIVHVDFATQVRSLKTSARWYGAVSTANALPPPGAPVTARR